MMIPSAETSSSVIPPAAAPMMGLGTETSISEVDDMTMTTSSIYYNAFITIYSFMSRCVPIVYLFLISDIFDTFCF